MNTAGANVAIESVYRDGLGQFRGFFGFRQKIDHFEQRTSFWQDVVAATKAYDAQAPGEQLAAWLALLGQPSLMRSEPAGVKLGVFNQWLSAGPVDLVTDRLEESDINDGPDWLRNGATAPICKESFWLTPERVWVAELASVEKDGTFVLDTQLLPI